RLPAHRVPARAARRPRRTPPRAGVQRRQGGWRVVRSGRRDALPAARADDRTRHRELAAQPGAGGEQAQGRVPLDAVARAASADLLDAVRIAAGRVRLSGQPVAMHELLSAAAAAARPMADAKGPLLTTVLSDEVDTVPGDPDRLQQVVWNLLTNAIKFTPQG